MEGGNIGGSIGVSIGESIGVSIGENPTPQDGSAGNSLKLY